MHLTSTVLGSGCAVVGGKKGCSLDWFQSGPEDWSTLWLGAFGALLEYIS